MNQIPTTEYAKEDITQEVSTDVKDKILELKKIQESLGKVLGRIRLGKLLNDSEARALGAQAKKTSQVAETVYHLTADRRKNN